MRLLVLSVWSATISSAILGLGSLSVAHAQSEAAPRQPTPWSWLNTKNGSAPPKPSADQAPVGTSAAPSAGIPHVLRQTTCNIPFTIDASKSAPVELQLFVSQDRGENWKFYAKAMPSVGHFTFRAVTDGEHWFALRSVEKGATTPDVRKLKPGLKVYFDTVEPELRFEPRLSETGEVSVTWKANDPTLKAESLKVEYQADPRSPWQMVMLPGSRQELDGSVTGQYAWIAEPSAGSLLVRAEVSDRAGNKTVVSRRLMARQLANGSSADEFRPRSPSSPTYPVGHEAVTWPADNQLPPRQQSVAVAPHGELPPPKPAAANGPPAITSQAVRNPFVSANQPASEGQPTPPTSSAIEPPAVKPLAADPGLTASTEEVVAPRTEGSAHTPFELPSGERPRMTNAKQFSLDYEIDSLGPSGVARVELWGTADGGRSWKHWQDDADHTSPLEVAVELDGIYGFRIVIVGSNRLSGTPPQPGDPADLWVGVDTAAPTVRLTSAIYGEGDHAGQLDIRWQAIDVWFTDRPISLSFAEQPQGPWTTIAAGLPNTGQYFWAVDPRIPRQIHLRIEARDEAGNVADHQIQDAISTGGLVPQGRIRGLRRNSTPPAGERSAAAEFRPLPPR